MKYQVHAHTDDEPVETLWETDDYAAAIAAANDNEETRRREFPESKTLYIVVTESAEIVYTAQHR